MNVEDIELSVADVLIAHEITSLPVDPTGIAEAEEICLLPGTYDNCFDGRIEYRRRGNDGRFYLFYAKEEHPFRPWGRVRFSIAHELGHFYLPDHRQYLLSGRWHSSHSDFVSSKEKEREADQFAASLLMPREWFEDEVRSRSGFLTLPDLMALAADVFVTSITSTIIRYIELNFEPCCMVLSEKGHVLYSTRSDDLHTQGMGWVQRGARVPGQSITAKASVAALEGDRPSTEGSVDSSVWFDARRSYRMWEEVLLLTRTGRVLTFLTPEDRSADDDD
jgi:hypothetical protein